jgi:hypothetical protein
MSASAVLVAIGMWMNSKEGTSLNERIKEGVHDWFDEFSKLVRTTKQRESLIPDKTAWAQDFIHKTAKRSEKELASVE